MTPAFPAAAQGREALPAFLTRPWSQLPSAGRGPRTALIGVSGYAQIYLNLIREVLPLGALSVTAAVIINPVEEASVVRELAALGCRIYPDYESMLAAEAGKLDLCLIPTGIPWHTPMTIAALRAGANVLVEKPLAGSHADSEAIRAAELASGRWVAVGFQDLYPGQTRWLKEQLVAGIIGKVRSIRFVGMWPRGASYYLRNNWAGRLQLDGRSVQDSPLNNAFGHFVNLSLYFASDEVDDAATVSSVEASLLRAHAIETFDTAIVRATTSGGVRLFMATTHLSHEVYEPEIMIEGERGRVRWLHEEAFELSVGGNAPVRVAMPNAMDARRLMFASVLRRVSGLEARVCGTKIACRHAAFIDAVHGAAAVQVVPEGKIEWTPLQNDSSLVPCLVGIEKALREAFQAAGAGAGDRSPVGSTLAALLK